MGGQQSREPPAEGESEKDKKDKKAKKYEQPAPTRVGKKKKKSGPAPSQKLPDVKPTTKCRLRLLKLDRVHDYLLMEQEFVARQEQIKPMEEKAMEERAKVDDIRGSPMGVATLEEMIDDNHAIISSSVGPEYYVNIMSFVDKDQLEPGSSLLTHNKVNSIVGILADEVDPMVSVMKVDKAPTESYADIGGLETQIQEIKEAVELPLTHPELYEDIGIKPPKGVILYGEPGTGKTLLAKAVANQTSATFLRVTGSELIQKYLGDGPKLVRELFRVAEENAPTIVFIDEIDAVGTKRYDSQSGGEREIQRTMLELLNQLDGFDARTDVKVSLAPVFTPSPGSQHQLSPRPAPSPPPRPLIAVSPSSPHLQIAVSIISSPTPPPQPSHHSTPHHATPHHARSSWRPTRSRPSTPPSSGPGASTARSSSPPPTRRRAVISSRYTRAR